LTDEDSWSAYVHARDEAMAGYGRLPKKSSNRYRAQVGVNFDVHYKQQTLNLSTNEKIAFDAIVIYNQVHQPIQNINLEQKLKMEANSQKPFELQIPKGIYDVALIKNNKPIGHRQLKVSE